MYILAVDIGGTAIKYGIFNAQGEQVGEVNQVPTIKSETDNAIMETIIDLVYDLKQNYDLKGIAISTAGMVDPKEGSILFAGPTIPGYTGTKIKERIETICDIPCEVENDVNCAALGEWWKGAGQGSDALFCVTLGTGLGGALILNGTLWTGATYSAGEIGYLPMNNGNTLQDEASVTRLIARYTELSGVDSKDINGKFIFDQLYLGDQYAQQALEEVLDALNYGLLAAIYLIAPDTIVIGGGIAAQKEYLTTKITENLYQSSIDQRILPKNICCATLGNKAGMIGAVYHFICQQGIG